MSALPDFYPELVAKIRARLVPDPARAGCMVFPQKRGKQLRVRACCDAHPLPGGRP